MSITAKHQRLENLHNVLDYCARIEKKSFGRFCVFTTGERICINQERGSILSQLSHENHENFKHEVRDYKCPESIETKIKFTLKKL